MQFLTIKTTLVAAVSWLVGHQRLSKTAQNSQILLRHTAGVVDMQVNQLGQATNGRVSLQVVGNELCHSLITGGLADTARQCQDNGDRRGLRQTGAKVLLDLLCRGATLLRRLDQVWQGLGDIHGVLVLDTLQSLHGLSKAPLLQLQLTQQQTGTGIFCIMANGVSQRLTGGLNLPRGQARLGQLTIIMGDRPIVTGAIITAGPVNDR